MWEIDKTLIELTPCNFNVSCCCYILSSSCYGFEHKFLLIAAHHRVLSAFSYISKYHRLLVNPGQLLKKIMSATKQGNCVLIYSMDRHILLISGDIPVMSTSQAEPV